MSSQTGVIAATQKWMEVVVIAHNFCPFARSVFDADSIHYQVSEVGGVELALREFSSACQLLDAEAEIETALLIFASSFADFDDYLDLVAAAQELLELSGYEGIYQVASFHPRYCFEGAAENDAANYTNRSPYPMLHVLREESVEKAIGAHPDPEAIPAANIAFARRRGSEYFQQLLHTCVRR